MEQQKTSFIQKSIKWNRTLLLIIPMVALLLSSVGITLASQSNKTAGGAPQVTQPYVTFYGFDDNDDGNGHYGNDVIAYTVLGHSHAWEATGTYNDPIPFAADIKDIGSGKYFQPGTLVFLSYLQKYFVLADQCANCDSLMDGIKASFHIDMWTGPDHLTQNNGGQNPPNSDPLLQ